MSLTTFPGLIDTFPDVDSGAGDDLDTFGKEHDELHNKLKDAVLALEMKVGLDGSLDPSSLTALLAEVDAALIRAAGTQVGVPGGADDTVLVTTARTAAGVGGVLVFSAGTYVVTGLAASVADQHWILRPGSVIKTKNGADTPTIDVTANGVRIDGGGTIDGNRANQTNTNAATGATACVRIISRSNVTVSGLLIKDGLSNGVLIDAGTNVHVKGNRVQGCAAAGNQKQVLVYAAVGSSAGNDISDNDIDSTGSANGCIAVTIATSGRSATGTRIVNNTCRVGNGGSSYPTLGIELFTSNATGGTISDSMVQGNRVLGPSSAVATDLIYGISIGGTASDADEGIDSNTVNGNIVRDCPASGIEIVGSGVAATGNPLTRCGALSVNATNTTGGIAGVSVTGNPIIDSVDPSYAILIEGGTNGIVGLVLEGNPIHNSAGASVITIGGVVTGASIARNPMTECSGTGIVLGGDFTDSTIDGCLIDLTGVGGTTADGILISASTTTGSSLTDNKIRNAPRSGIHGLVATSDLSIQGNDIKGCQDGLKAVAAQANWSVYNNVIADNVDRGLIFAVASTDLAIASNTIHDNPGGNYYTVGSTFLTHVINGAGG